MSFLLVGVEPAGPRPIVGLAQALARVPDAALLLILPQSASPVRFAAELRNATELPVHRIRSGTALRPGRVYLAAADKPFVFRSGSAQRSSSSGREAPPACRLLHSIAEEYGERAAVLAFSPTRPEVASGIAAIRSSGGIALGVREEGAAEPADALPEWFDGWGTAEELAETLGTLLTGKTDALQGAGDEQIRRIVNLIRVRTGMDFACYKSGTLSRRIARRAGLARAGSLDAYRHHLEKNEAEIARLTEDLLIGTTGFFRDPESFDYLGRNIISEICGRGAPDSPIRVWVPGAATGEEAYSIAMLVVEHLDKAKRTTKGVQIFATDINVNALERARKGVYPLSIASDVSPERLKHFFAREDDQYRVKKQLRDLITFAVQNVTTDPPFSRIDLIACRNLLIYLVPEAQKRVLSVFNFALAEDGYLFTGPAETLGESADLFKPIDKRHRVYQRIAPANPRVMNFAVPALPPGPATSRSREHDESLRLAGRRVLQEHYAPPAVVVNAAFEVEEIFGDVSRFLRLQPGRPTTDLIELALPPLKPKLRSLIFQKRMQADPEIALTTTMPDTHSGTEHPLRLSIRQVKRAGAPHDAYLIVFDMQPGSVVSIREGEMADEQAARLLEEELSRTRNDLQTTIEQLETANEELKASNEEVMSMNEEFQSTNEELETSREELQSMNLELTTLNDQLEEKVRELERSRNDINNLLESTHVGAIFLDRDLRIQLFTPAVTELINLIPSDIGRPFEDIAQQFDDGALIEDSRTVLRTLKPVDRQIAASDGRHFLRRILPYRTEDNRIDGVVLTFVDVTEQKEAERHRARLAAIVEGSDHVILGKTLEGIITDWNRGAEQIYGYRADEVIGKSVGIIFPPEAPHETMEPYYEQLRAGKRVPPMEVVRVRKDGTRLNMMLTISPIIAESGEVVGASSIATDITPLKTLEAQLQELNADLERRVAERTREVEERAGKIRELALQMTRTEQDERRRIARILHDTVQQLHIAAKMRIQQIGSESSNDRVRTQVEDAVDLLDQATQASRTLTVELYPPVLGHSGIRAALAWLKDRMAEQHEFEVILNTEEDAEPAAAELKFVVFECARELMLNAVKHSGVNRAEALLSRQGNFLHLRVRDEGSGCDEKIPCSQAASYGLGAMRERLELMGGSLEIRTSPGQGFCVDVRFRDVPNQDRTPVPGSERLRICDCGDTGQRVRVAVVDDHDVVRSGIVAALEHTGHVAVVGEAMDGEAAVYLTRLVQPHVVLMDVNMPRLNGIEATRLIAAEHPAIAVVGLSVNDDAGTRVEMQAAGAAAYIGKGAPVEDLVEAIQSAASRTGDRH